MRGTFFPKDGKIHSLPTASAIAVGPAGRDAVLYSTTLTSPIGALARTLERVSGVTNRVGHAGLVTPLTRSRVRARAPMGLVNVVE